MFLTKRKSYLPGYPLLFDDFFTKDLYDRGYFNNSTTNSTIPSVNIIENEEAFMVEMAAPGMEKNDFKIELENEMLTISSQKEEEKNLKENSHYSLKEYNYLSFQRTFKLPKLVVNESKIKAKYENGILQVLIPKREEAKKIPPRIIHIQ